MGPMGPIIRIALRYGAGGNPGTWSVTKQAGPVGGTSNAPAFVGQIAVATGVAHIATGTASAADWKQITN